MDRYDEFSYGIKPGQTIGMQTVGPLTSTLTKQVDQISYEIPQNKYVRNHWSYAPEFLKVFSDVKSQIGGKAIFDCMLLGTPRPKVCWLFNSEVLNFEDVRVEDTADVCRLTIPCVKENHYGEYTVFCENEIGRATASASLLPL